MAPWTLAKPQPPNDIDQNASRLSSHFTVLPSNHELRQKLSPALMEPLLLPTHVLWFISIPGKMLMDCAVALWRLMGCLNTVWRRLVEKAWPEHPEDLPKLFSHLKKTLDVFFFTKTIGGKIDKLKSLLYSLYICLFHLSVTQLNYYSRVELKSSK